VRICSWRHRYVFPFYLNTRKILSCQSVETEPQRQGQERGSVWVGLRMTDFLSARTVPLLDCLSVCRVRMRYPWPAGRRAGLWTACAVGLVYCGENKHQTAHEVGRRATLASRWVRTDKPAVQNWSYLFKYPQFKNRTTGKRRGTDFMGNLKTRKRYNSDVASFCHIGCSLLTCLRQT
jgi:hypothetical protein